MVHQALTFRSLPGDLWAAQMAEIQRVHGNSIDWSLLLGHHDRLSRTLRIQKWPISFRILDFFGNKQM